MKRAIAFALCALLILSAMPAWAEGKLTVTSKNAFIYSGKDSGVFVARVENTGDAPIYYDDGQLVIFSADDEILTTENYVYSSPGSLLLGPGEYTYVYEFLWDSALEDAAIEDVKFSVSGDTRGYEYEMIPSEAEIAISGGNSYDNYVNVTFTNETDEVLYGAYVVCALEDKNGEVVFVGRNGYDSLGVHPGGTVTVKMYIDADLIDYYEDNGIEPAAADSMVYFALDD